MDYSPEIRVEPILTAAGVMAEVLSVPPVCEESGCKHEVEIGEAIRRYRPDLDVLMPRQTHTVNVAIAERADDVFEETDALVTFRKGLRIGVRTADCVPIVLWAPDVEGVAAVHAGWKGTLGGIVERTLDVLESRGAKREEIRVAFGPSIGVKRYEVDEGLAERFREAGFGSCVSYPDGEGSRPHLDLQRVNIERLIRRGVNAENIRLSNYCTFNAVLPDGRPRYPSYRRDGGTALRLVTSVVLTM